jgi:hypothetical protein
MTLFPIGRALFPIAAIALIAGCSPVNTTNYSATAHTKYTWQVEYDNGADRTPGRIHDFAMTNLITYNGVRPEQAVTGPDEQGLFWPALPPKPGVDAIENYDTNPNEKPGPPLLNKTVDYEVTYNRDGQNVTVSTNYDVYRTIVKNAATQTPLKFTLGIDDKRVEKAEPATETAPK